MLGTLLGLGAADRNGGPIRMALELASSLADLGRFSAEDVLRRHLDWWQTEGFDAGQVSGSAVVLCRSLIEGATWNIAMGEAISRGRYPDSAIPDAAIRGRAEQVGNRLALSW